MTAPLTHDCLSQSSAIPNGEHCPARKEKNLLEFFLIIYYAVLYKVRVNPKTLAV